MIIETSKLGNTTIQIDDSYMVSSQDEIDRILERVAEICRK